MCQSNFITSSAKIRSLNRQVDAKYINSIHTVLRVPMQEVSAKAEVTQEVQYKKTYAALSGRMRASTIRKGSESLELVGHLIMDSKRSVLYHFIVPRSKGQSLQHSYYISSYNHFIVFQIRSSRIPVWYLQI